MYVVTENFKYLVCLTTYHKTQEVAQSTTHAGNSVQVTLWKNKFI